MESFDISIIQIMKRLMLLWDSLQLLL